MTDSNSTVMRYDRAPLGKLTEAPDGSLRGDAVITRAGVFLYQGPAGETIREFRPPEEVFKADSIMSAQMIPVTIEHPEQRRVTPDNAKALAVGWTGESVRQDGQNVVSPVRIFAKDGIAAIKNGKRQLSLGYSCEVDRADGVWEGQQYTHVQRRINYNHLALTDVARAGDVASVRLDAADAVQIIEPPPTPAAGQGAGRSRTMVPIRLDSGISYDVPPEVDAAWRARETQLSELQTKLDAAEVEKVAAVKAKDAAEGERDSAKDELEKATKTDSAKLAEAVKARLSLLEAARKAGLEKDVAEKLDSMSDSDVRIAVIKSRQDKFDPEGKSEDYIQARFDSVVEQLEDAPDVGAQIMGGGSGGKETRVDTASAREAYAKRLRDASRGIKED